MYKNMGVYKVVNLKTGEMYVGSTIDFSGRVRTHKAMLLRNKHTNQALQTAWNKYGERYFKFAMIEVCNQVKLKERERYHVKRLKPKYNPLSRGSHA